MSVSEIDTLFVPTYARSGSPMVKGKGMYLFDEANKKYLDFGAGIAVSALGHSHPLMVKTLKTQGANLLHASNLYFTKTQIDLAKLLIKKSFGDKVFLCNSGTEANEACIKFARKWASKTDSEKYHVLSFTDGFHGRTYGSLAATAQPKFHSGFGPLMAGFHYAPLNDIKAAKKILDIHKFCAIIIEPIQGESGVNAASKEFLAFLRTYATKNKIALIFDEIQCGMGRTGTLFAYEQCGVVPDIMSLAKPLGGGLPLGAVVCTNDIANAISPGDHGTTFGGNALSCALGSALLETVSQKSFLSNVKKQGSYIKKQLALVAKKHKSIIDIRGSGLLIGVEFTEEPKKIIDLCREKGLLLIKAGNNTVRFIPPLIVTEKDTDIAIKIFAQVLNEIGW